MATDGVKIIDGDTAHDLYITFMDGYNNGAEIDELKQYYEHDKKSCSYEVTEYEICVTAYALAFWEIGELTAEMLAEVKAVVERKAGVEDRAEQCGAAAGKARQRELDKLLTKISIPKARPKKRTPPPAPTINEDVQKIIDEAENLKYHSEFDKAKALYRQLIADKKDLQDARYKYVEFLTSLPEHFKDYPQMGIGDYSVAIQQQQKFKNEHTDWAEIEEHCKYMLAHRDSNKMEVSKKKKRKIESNWYAFIASRLWNALIAQQKYEEAIVSLEEYIQFMQECEEFSFYCNEIGKIYQCYLVLDDAEKTEAFKAKCKAKWTTDKIDYANWDWDGDFLFREKILKEYGIC
jgi:hypothetical protein